MQPGDLIFYSAIYFDTEVKKKKKKKNICSLFLIKKKIRKNRMLTILHM